LICKMSEENQENEKRGIVKLIFKWIGLGLLVALIIGALAFDAPWKVIALLLVTLAAHTILPKSAVKWFWLSAAAVVIVLIIWVFLPDENGDWRPYTFDEELTALQAKYAIPEEENAAVIYNQLLVDYNENTIAPNLSDPDIIHLTWSEPWTSDEYPQVAEWLKGHENTIAKLIEASKFEKCSFPIVADVEAFSQHMEIVAPMRHWAFLLVCAANNDLAEGRFDQAIEKNLTILKMAKHIRQQPITIDMLTGVAIEALAIKQFNRFVVTCDATEEHLNSIEKAVAEIKNDWSFDLPRFLECEKLMFKNFLGMFYVVNSDGEIRLNPGIAVKAMMTRLPDDMKNKITPKYWQKKRMKVSTIWAWFYMPSTLQQASEIIDAKFKKYYAMAEPDFDWQREPPELHSFLTQWDFTRIRFSFNYFIERSIAMIGGSYYSLHDLYLRAIAEQRGSQIIIILRRYKNKTGHWPESLEEVKSFAPADIFVDPLNGDSFVYKRTEDNFTIYSKGKNSIDEGGEYETKHSDDYRKIEIIKDDWMIWPIRSKTSALQEVKKNDEQQ
jgi:hypothetical protein